MPVDPDEQRTRVPARRGAVALHGAAPNDAATHELQRAADGRPRSGVQGLGRRVREPGAAGGRANDARVRLRGGPTCAFCF